MNSNHKCEVIRLGPPSRHENADTLEIFRVFGWSVISKMGTWKEGDLAAYVVPDSLVDTTRPEFSFLKPRPNSTGHRIKAIRMRGVYSQGLLVPPPAGAVEGDDVAEQLGIRRYNPPEPLSSGGDNEKPPSGLAPCYDLESFQRYAATVLTEGEPIVVTEKIHGANARYTVRDGRLYCGSRTAWKLEDEKSIWWKAAKKYPNLTALLAANPGFVAYGEVFGQVQDLKYGRTGVDLMFFDLMRPDGTFLNARDAYAIFMEYGVPMVPALEITTFDREKCLALAEGPSMVEGAKHLREGCVIRPVQERVHPDFGRVVLKIVGNGYLERS